MPSGDAAVGVAAVAIAIASFGSFGVPIKSQRVLQAQVDPLVYQLYKSLACSLTSVVVLTFRPFIWTWWGLLGAGMWVLTGTLAIYAIQRAGLGIAQTTYSALSVFVSFCWGVLAFHEFGSNMGLSLLGLLLIAGGLAGLGHAVHATPRATLQRVPSAESTNFFLGKGGGGEQGPTTAASAQQLAAVEDTAASPRSSRRRSGRGQQQGQGEDGTHDEEPPAKPAGELGKRRGSAGGGGNGGSLSDLQVRVGSQLHHRTISSNDLAGGGGGEGGAGAAEAEDPAELLGASPTSSICKADLEGARLLGALGTTGPGELRIILRQNITAARVRLRAAWASGVGRGVLAAVLIGLLNGSFLVPYKLARKHDKAQGIEYVVPFALASLFVTLLACFGHYGLVRGRAPQLHLREVAGPALLTGALWSIGNMASIVAVQRLGLSVGFPLVQGQLVVSTAWAVLYYREVPRGLHAVLVFVGSTLVVVAGMMLLAVYGS